jgi:hypothetical protein
MALLTAEQLHEPARAESIEWPRTARKQPLVIPAAGGTPAIYTRATTFAGALEETSSLTKWKQRLTLLGAGLNRRLADAAARLDPAAPEGKKELNRLAWKAFVLGGGEKAQQQGTWRHLLTEYHDRGEELPSHSAEDAADLAAYVEATRPLQMLHIEEPVVLDRYRIAGTPDRILQTDLRTPDGRPAGIVIGDTKTGSIDLAALKIAMQLATYSRARLYNPVRHLSARPGEGEITEWRKRMFTREEAEAAYLPTPQINQDWGLIIHLPAGFGECSLHWIDLRIGWDALAVAAQVRSLRGRRDLLTPVEAVAGTGVRNSAKLKHNLSRIAIYPEEDV